MKIADIISEIEKFAPTNYQEQYDNAGLIVGQKNNECTGVIICLDSIECILEEAIAKNCNLIIAHHPIVFSGIKQITGKNYIERIIINAIQNNIAIYAAHTNLDNVQLGVNYKIGEKLNIHQPKILLPKKGTLKKLYTYVPSDACEQVLKALFDVGAGSIGNYSECSFSTNGLGTFFPNELAQPKVGDKQIRNKVEEQKIEVIFPNYVEQKVLNALISSHSYEEVAYEIIQFENTNQTIGSGMIGNLEHPIDETVFLHFLKQQFNAKMIRHTTLLGKPIQKVAWCGGSGSFLLNEAIRQGADIFITGDFTYHKFFDADNQILIADVGHFESEQFTSEIFLEIITKKFPNFAVQITENNTNPINYI
ncbi:MAG: Nif3-like dinuclear metal center hexameric protein [Sphingobacteriales bacterium]|nr:MAG: Nif3-like dinuclear metal center hexameric protein [Sphingobacteriales bacterium]